LRRTFFIAAFAGVFCSSLGWGQETSPLLSTAPATVQASTSPLTAAEEGESVSLPTPRAMTESQSPIPFVTLARSVVPGDALPANAEIVYPEKTRSFDAQNAGEALSHEVGLSLQPQGSPGYPSNVQIRGASADQTLVLIDGRPMEGVAFGAADLSEIPLEQIDHIEVVRGGMSALYGPNALGGVINVISKRAAYAGYPLSHVSYESASFSRQTYKLDFGSRMGPVDYFFYGDQQWQSGFRSNSDNSQHNIGGNFGVSMGRAGKLLVDVGSYQNNAGLPGFRCNDIVDGTCLTSTTPLDPSQFNNRDEKPASTPLARETTTSNSFRTSYLVDVSTDIFLAVRLFGHEREKNLDDSLDPSPAAAVHTDRHEHSKGGDLQLNLPLGFLVGGSVIHDHEDFADLLAPANSFGASEDNWGFFAQQTYHWSGLTVIPSGRYDKNNQYGHSANPRVQSMLDASDWLRFSASAGRSVRAPTIDEVHLNSMLDPERAWTYDAGFELHQSSMSFRANVFRANVDDLIQSSTFSAVNVGSARRQGVEIQFDHVVNEYFRHSWNYTYLENRGIPSGFDHRVALAFSPRHTVNYLASITPSRKWKIDNTLRYEDSRFSGNDGTGTKLGSQLVWDMRLAYQWRQLELFLGVNDINNRRYDEVPGFPLPGRTAYGGVSLRLWG
jgi:vitamin B12 transporter